MLVVNQFIIVLETLIKYFLLNLELLYDFSVNFSITFLTYSGFLRYIGTAHKTSKNVNLSQSSSNSKIVGILNIKKIVLINRTSVNEQHL